MIITILVHEHGFESLLALCSIWYNWKSTAQLGTVTHPFRWQTERHCFVMIGGWTYVHHKHMPRGQHIDRHARTVQIYLMHDAIRQIQLVQNHHYHAASRVAQFSGPVGIV